MIGVSNSEIHLMVVNIYCVWIWIIFLTRRFYRQPLSQIFTLHIFVPFICCTQIPIIFEIVKVNSCSRVSDFISLKNEILQQHLRWHCQPDNDKTYHVNGSLIAHFQKIKTSTTISFYVFFPVTTARPSMSRFYVYLDWIRSLTLSKYIIWTKDILTV